MTTATECCGVELGGGLCVFGCGSVVDGDTGICPTCHEHSANGYECPTCGATYEQWNGAWQRTPLRSENGVQRRIQLHRSTSAELAIRRAVDAVESAGADVLLTEAVNLLHAAHEKVADFVDREIAAGRMAMPQRAAVP